MRRALLSNAMPGGEHARASFAGTTSTSLTDVLASGQGIVADKVIACLSRADRQSLGLACKALQDEVAARWRCVRFWLGLLGQVLRSKMLPKLQRVEELVVHISHARSAVQDFYRLLLALNRNGARVKAIGLATATSGRPLLLPRLCSSTEQPHEWVLTADSLRKLQPAPYLERLKIRPGGPVVDALFFQPLLHASALDSAQLWLDDWEFTKSSLDLSACSNLQQLHVCSQTYDANLLACLVVLQPAPSLKHLHAFAFDVHSQCLQHISRSFPGLESLHLGDCQLWEPDADADHELLPSSFSNLKILEFTLDAVETYPVEHAFRQLLSSMTGLRQLILSFSGPLPPLPFDSPDLPQLQELVITEQGRPHGDVNIHCALLETLAEHQRRLRKLTLITDGTYWSEDFEWTMPLSTHHVQAFLDAAPSGLELLRLEGFNLVFPKRLVLPAAAVGLLRLDITPIYYGDDSDAPSDDPSE